MSDLRGTLGTDITAARELLARGVGTITLRPLGGQLIVEMRGNLVGLLGLEPVCPTMAPGARFRPYQTSLASCSSHSHRRLNELRSYR